MPTDGSNSVSPSVVPKSTGSTTEVAQNPVAAQKPTTEANKPATTAQATKPAVSDKVEITTKVNLNDIGSIESTITNFFKAYPSNKSSLGQLQKAVDDLIEGKLDSLNELEKLLQTLIEMELNSDQKSLKYIILARIANKVKLLSDKPDYQFTVSTALLAIGWLDNNLPAEIKNKNENQLKDRFKDLKLIFDKKLNTSQIASGALEGLSFIGPSGAFRGAKVAQRLSSKLPWLAKYFNGAPLENFSMWLGSSTNPYLGKLGGDRFINWFQNKMSKGIPELGTLGVSSLVGHAGKQIAPMVEEGANGGNLEDIGQSFLGAQSLSDFAKNNANKWGFWSTALDTGGILALTAAGATVGSIVPGVGTTIGAGVGFVLGGWNALIDSHQKGRFISPQQITEELQAIEEKYTAVSAGRGENKDKELASFITDSSYSSSTESQVAQGPTILPPTYNTTTTTTDDSSYQSNSSYAWEDMTSILG